jgi:hypothetical protein
MDTSETYIKMRIKAIPDLGMGKPPEPFDEDIIIGKDTFNWQTDRVFIDAKGDFYYSDEEVACQLERQDQLQEMIRRTDIYARPLVAIFAKWVHEELEYILLRHLISMEQLWLAFVYHEKYHKAWNGETWVKKEEP